MVARGRVGTGEMDELFFFILSKCIFLKKMTSSNKRQRLLDSIKEQDPTICCLKGSHFKYKHTNKSKRIENDIPC